MIEGRMRIVFALCLAVGMISCQDLGSKLEWPAPYEQEGIRVTVDGFYRQGMSIVGISGTAENLGTRDLRVCTINFDVIDSDGVKVGDAMAFTNGLAGRQKWRFQAPFTTPFQITFKEIRPGRITVF